MTREGGRWFRLNTTWSQSEWIACLAPAARLAWVELLGYVKAHGYDGKVRSVSPLIFSRMVGIDTADVAAMLDAAIADEALENADGTWVITGWKEHQGDPTGRDRVERYRKKKSEVTDVTRYNRDVTPTETETKTETKTDTSVLKLSAREPYEASADDIIRAANRGMIDNRAIGDRCHPIHYGHGSRQDVLDWLAQGVPADVAAQVVHERARDWKPSGNRRQITSMKYFTDAVLDAFARFQAASTPAPNGHHDRRSEREAEGEAPGVRKAGSKFAHLVEPGDRHLAAG